MPAPEGNQFWKARSKHGDNPAFASPEDLWTACNEYFEWSEANPLLEERVFHTNGLITRADVAKMRAMTIEGLCVFLDINSSTWRKYRQKEDFGTIITRVEQIIRTQKFEGAAAEMLNPNIIARDLGLANKSELGGPGGGPIRIDKPLTDDELLAIASRGREDCAA